MLPLFYAGIFQTLLDILPFLSAFRLWVLPNLSIVHIVTLNIAPNDPCQPGKVGTGKLPLETNDAHLLIQVSRIAAKKAKVEWVDGWMVAL